MGSTVPSCFRPSGGMVLPFAPAIPVQPVAADAEPLKPPTWTFTDRESGRRLSFTCMPGCIRDHRDDVATPTHRDDIWCSLPRQDITLPINENGRPEEFQVLGMSVNVSPFGSQVSERLPHIDLEVVDDHWIEGLDPDGFETVINTLANRLDEMRAAHARLVELRAQYRGQVQR
ncbi:hypothetical protein AB0N23_02560 [Streptomyces sp. NPDC052644]